MLNKSCRELCKNGPTQLAVNGKCHHVPQVAQGGPEDAPSGAGGGPWAMDRDSAGAGDGAGSGGAEAGGDTEGDEAHAAQRAGSGSRTLARERARAQGDGRQDEQGDCQVGQGNKG